MVTVCLDPGHGKTTPGKRSPLSLGLPQVFEWEFNRSVAWATEQALDRCGISHVRSVSDDSDPKYTPRAKVGQKNGCALFVSIHANAGGGTGIEAFHWEQSTTGQRLARLVATEVVKTTHMRYRGLKTKITYQGKLVDPSVLVYATQRGMHACLVECGFMDNAQDIVKLRDHNYKMQCGEGIARGICLFLGVA